MTVLHRCQSPDVLEKAAVRTRLCSARHPYTSSIPTRIGRRGNAHKEIEDQVQKRLLEVQALTQRDVRLPEADREQRRAAREREARTALLEREPR
jgi:hypothetical protein